MFLLWDLKDDKFFVRLWVYWIILLFTGKPILLMVPKTVLLYRERKKVSRFEFWKQKSYL